MAGFSSLSPPVWARSVYQPREASGSQGWGQGAGQEGAQKEDHEAGQERGQELDWASSRSLSPNSRHHFPSLLGLPPAALCPVGV
jgi:hypothetical protein